MKRSGRGICAAAILLAVTGCGGSGSSDTGSEATSNPAPTTSAGEVRKLVQLFRDNRKQAEEDAATRDECGDVTPIKNYSRECAKPWAELVAARLSETEAIVNELKTQVGKGCREALSGGNPYIPLDTKKISACSADVGQA